MRPVLAFLLWCCCLAACVELELQADLAGPRVWASSLTRPRNVEVPTMPRIFVDFSEAIDPASLRIALIPWQEVGNCEFTPICAAEGSSCERGRCMRDRLSAAQIARLADAAIDGSIPLLPPDLESSPIGPGPRVWVVPRQALQARTRHTLLVFARDLSGAPLVDADGAASTWRVDLVTAGEGSGGPEARLVAPPSATEAVPINLQFVATRFVRPVALDPAATLRLLAEDGSSVPLVDPQPCEGWVPGLCLRWRPGGPVLPDMSYRPGGGTLRDLLGQPAVPPAETTWFRTASAPDLAPPVLGDVTFTARGPCLYARMQVDEPVQAELAVGDRRDVAAGGPGALVLALRGEDAAATLRAEDLAGNLSERSLPVLEDSPIGPPLGLAEILANPRGPEPAQEFIELADLRDDGPPQQWSDLHIADATVEDVLAGHAGDPLPPFTTRPGERVIVVAASYDPGEGSDPAPLPGTQTIRVDASLGAGGLKNAGEPVTLYFRTGDEAPLIVASYGNHIATDAPAHAGRSVAADPHACDLARAWASHASGSSTPGSP